MELSDMTQGYPFVFVFNDYQTYYPHHLYTLQYRFKSLRSNHSYIVRIESYEQHVYCVKFYDKAMSDSINKFSLRSNTFEPRTIFYTILRIMLDVYRKDAEASFFFIGAEDERDHTGESTRRYRIYKRFVSSVISNEVFEHFRVNELSLYILLNRKHGSTEIVDIITSYVRQALNENI